MTSELYESTDSSELNNLPSTSPVPANTASDNQDASEVSPYYKFGNAVAHLKSAIDQRRNKRAPDGIMNSDPAITSSNSDLEDLLQAIGGFAFAFFIALLYTIYQAVIYLLKSLLSFFRILLNLLLKAVDYRGYKAKKEKWVNDKLAIFDNLPIPDNEIKSVLSTLRPKVKTYETFLAAKNILPDFVDDKVFFTILGLSLLGAPLYPLIWLRIDIYSIIFTLFSSLFSFSLPQDFLIFILAYIFTSITFFALGLFFILILLYIGGIISSFWKPALYIWLFIGLTAGIYLLHNILTGQSNSLRFNLPLDSTFNTKFITNILENNQNSLFLVAGSLLQIILMLIGELMGDAVASLIRISTTKKCEDHHPIAIAVDNFISILIADSVWNSDECVEFENKQALLLKLEVAAKTIEYQIPRNIQTGDAVTDLWFSKRLLQVATALREKKKWILTPKEDTRYHFVNNIARNLVCVLKSDWDTLTIWISEEELEFKEMEDKETETDEHPQFTMQVLMFFLKSARKILAAAFPIGVFFVLQHFFPNFLQGGLLTSVISIIAFLEITILASILDPDFSKKTLDAQDFMNKLYSIPTKK